MVRTIGRLLQDHGRVRRQGAQVRIIFVALVCALGFGLAGCTGSGTTTSTGSSESTGVTGAHMAGPQVDVVVDQKTVDAKPKAPVLTSPESAVRSYLDWTAYAYRIAQSKFSKPTESAAEDVRVDSYIQYNIQKQRRIDQKLVSITFGTPKVTGNKATITAKEEWTYKYIDISAPNKVIGEPRTAKYDVTYTLIKNGDDWVVDKVDAKAVGKVK